MAIRRQLPPRHLSWLFVATTLALATALVWLGVALLRQDRALEAQRVRDDLQRVAVSAGEELARRIDAIEAELERIASLAPMKRDSAITQLGADLAPGAVVIDASPPDFRAAPAGVLHYDPSFSSTTSLSPAEFAAAESLEFRARDMGAAEREYRRLAQSTDERVAGGALLRLGRVLQKQRKSDEAMRVFGQLARYDLDFDGVPAPLLGGHAALVVREELKDQAAVRAGAEALAVKLNGGAWRLTRSAFEFYAGELARMTSGAPLVMHEAMALSRAADSLYHAWPSAAAGRDLIRLDSTSVLAIWRAAPSFRAVFLALPRHTKTWIAAMDSMMRQSGAALALADGAGHWLVPPVSESGPRVSRDASETGLPWTIGVQSLDPSARSADLAVRRRILFSVLVVAVLLVLVGTYAVARAVNRELAAARMQSDFVSAVSHEFRTPLTSLRQVSELLAAGRVTSDTRRAEFHEVLNRETGRLHRLVENLLDFGRFEAGAHEFRFERLTPIDVVAPVVEEFRSEVAPRGYDVVLHQQVTGEILADRQAMALALRNLLDNAVKYSGSEKRIDVTLSKPNGVVALSIRDRGIGIPPDERESIFNRFTRGKGVRTSGIPGTGIGLAMVQHIVREHGGEVRVSSTVGEGSTFTILLKPVDA